MATYMKVWLEDNLLLVNLILWIKVHTQVNKKAILSEVYFGLVENRKVEFKSNAKSRRK
jgi:hypothetical protein